MKGKRGLSTVVATVMIILVTVVAITVLAQFIIPFVRNNLARSTECIDYQDYFKFENALGYNCYTSARIILSVRAKLDENLARNIAGFNLVFLRQGESKVKSIRQGGTEDGVKMLSGASALTVSGTGETQTYNYTTTSTYDFVEIYPVLKSGRICEKRSDKLNLFVCS